MKVPDKIDAVGPVREDALKGGGTGPGLRIEKSIEAVAAKLPEAVRLEEADVFTISDELKSVISSLSRQAEPGRTGGPDEKEIRAFILGLLKDRALPEEKPGAAISGPPDIPRALDVVSISKDTAPLLRSVMATGAGEAREMHIPPGTGMSPFLTAMLNELFPELGIKLFKVYRRKNGRAPGNKKGDEEKQQPEKEAAAPGLNSALLKGYGAGRMTFSAAGLIRTADNMALPFALELDVTPAPEEARGGGIMLAPLVINYGGPASALDDSRFTFGPGNEDAGGRTFSGGAGRITIDMAEVGKAADGSAIYGPDMGPWTEE